MGVVIDGVLSSDEESFSSPPPPRGLEVTFLDVVVKS